MSAWDVDGWGKMGEGNEDELKRREEYEVRGERVNV